jgi:hypothetical protein
MELVASSRLSQFGFWYMGFEVGRKRKVKRGKTWRSDEHIENVGVRGFPKDGRYA